MHCVPYCSLCVPPPRLEWDMAPEDAPRCALEAQVKAHVSFMGGKEVLGKVWGGPVGGDRGAGTPPEMHTELRAPPQLHLDLAQVDLAEGGTHW